MYGGLGVLVEVVCLLRISLTISHSSPLVILPVAHRVNCKGLDLGSLCGLLVIS